jgi:signal transduction histidine kinase
MALLFTLLLGAAVSILAYIGFYFSRDAFIHSTEAAIEADLSHYADWDSEGRLAEKITQHAKTDNRRIHLLLNAKGEKIAGNIPALPQDVTRLAEGTILFKGADTGTQYAARIVTFEDGRQLLSGLAIGDIAARYHLMVWLSVLCIVCMIAVILVSFLISGFVVSRTDHMATIASKIMETGNLNERIRIDSRWDDLSFLSAVLNKMLARIELLVEGVRRVSDNVAHDLRTPLTRLRAGLEQLSREEGVEPRVKERVSALMGEADHLLSTFAALLRIAHIENAKAKKDFTALRLDSIVQDVIELYEPLAQEKAVKIEDTLSPAEMKGDRDLLFQACANLLDNALKFTPKGGVITIACKEEGDCVLLSVSDTGAGIEEHEQDKIFQRFYRAEASRHTPGNGLGLSMVDAIIRHHEGQISVSSLHPGVRFSIRLPL